MQGKLPQKNTDMNILHSKSKLNGRSYALIRRGTAFATSIGILLFKTIIPKRYKLLHYPVKISFGFVAYRILLY
jgi:hypothetical protein